MSHQVLARKWRPHTFEAMVGQQPILQALQNALTQQRLHHAYLLTGTRGVGKTTLGRILAKCFNCQTGVTPTPCNTCDHCCDIDKGCFVDLLEVDAASRTKVEDTRDLLDNAQYTPAQGRYKIYLIDEVHMLSGHSFNALLKTLEEPPAHVIFILATTDPQRLPITVLSRCLQFHLKPIPSHLISKQLVQILKEEHIEADKSALDAIACSADGSLRDALTLLEQAIAFADNQISLAAVQTMLGLVDDQLLLTLLEALQADNANVLLQTISQLAEMGTDFYQAFDQLLALLHQLTIVQIAPDVLQSHGGQSERITVLSQHFSLDTLQVLYQIALLAKRDLSLAPSARMGFEMACIRLYTFSPMCLNAQPVSARIETQSVVATEVTATPTSTPADTPPSVTEASAPPVVDANDWAKLIARLDIQGLTHALAQHCSLAGYRDDQFELVLAPSHQALLNPSQKQDLTNAISQYLQKPVSIEIKLGEPASHSPAKHKAAEQIKATAKAAAILETDKTVKMIENVFNAKMELGAVEPCQSE